MFISLGPKDNLHDTSDLASGRKSRLASWRFGLEAGSFGDFLFLVSGVRARQHLLRPLGRRRWKRKSFVIAGKSSLFFGEDVTSDYKPSFLSLA